MKAICKRELRALLGGFRGWGYAAIVLLGAAVSVLFHNIISGTPRFEINISYIALSMVPATALATADAFQAESRQNTERLLYSLPIRNADVVLGKLLAHMVPVVITCLLLCVFPLVLMLFSSLSLGTALASIVALLFLGAAMMALGLAISASSRHWYTSVLATIAVLAVSWAAPYIAEYISMITSVTLPVMAACMLIAYTTTYVLSSDATLGIIMAGVIEVPTLLAYLRGDGAGLMKTFAGGVRSLSLFEGLNTFINGMFDGSVLIMYLAVAVMFGFITFLCVGNRRQAKRRAL